MQPRRYKMSFIDLRYRFRGDRHLPEVESPTDILGRWKPKKTIKSIALIKCTT